MFNFLLRSLAATLLLSLNIYLVVPKELTPEGSVKIQLTSNKKTISRIAEIETPEETTSKI